MTKKEAAEMAAAIVAAYPNYDKFKNETAVRSYVNMLALMFEAEPGGAVGLAVKKHIATSKWPPSIAEIRELMMETQHPEIVPPDLAWAAVSDLIFTLGRSQWHEAKKRLPDLIGRAVEIIGWKNLHDMHADGGGKPGMDRVAFFNQYSPMYERAKREAMTPPQVAATITSKRAALPDTSHRLIEDAETARRMKELEIARARAAQQRAMEEALKRDEEERLERLAKWRAKHGTVKVDPANPAAALSEIMKGDQQHAQ